MTHHQHFLSWTILSLLLGPRLRCFALLSERRRIAFLEQFALERNRGLLETDASSRALDVNAERATA
jgi:superfamily II DNA/RNA helicase